MNIYEVYMSSRIAGFPGDIRTVSAVESKTDKKSEIIGDLDD